MRDGLGFVSCGCFFRRNDIQGCQKSAVRVCKDRKEESALNSDIVFKWLQVAREQFFLFSVFSLSSTQS